MRSRLIIFIVTLVLMTVSSGCSLLGYTVSQTGGSPLSASIIDQERRFSGALVFLRAGNEQAARELFEQTIEGPVRSGVTDEALFRLSVLYLRDEGVKGTARALDLIERLRSEFPQSIWTHQAAPLEGYLAGARTLRDRQREVKTLKELNLSLSRDNREMRQSMERLKNLDIELEKRIKR